ncbi:hypothetical protein [Chitinolyticbacter meiyuanensis]|uniref:hypothetical protein n=1 Tax=Chitinolyticbacter meiyuanensis TaxID=682798 RepID=UPI0011E59801|nr:hypothetical protein [Chitinolyticbacter meiyuanensis]
MNDFTHPPATADTRKIAAWRAAILQDNAAQPLYGRTLEVSTGSLILSCEQPLREGARARVYLELPGDGGGGRLYADFQGQLLACTLMQGSRYRMQWRVLEIGASQRQAIERALQR